MIFCPISSDSAGGQGHGSMYSSISATSNNKRSGHDRIADLHRQYDRVDHIPPADQGSKTTGLTSILRTSSAGPGTGLVERMPGKYYTPVIIYSYMLHFS